MNGTPTGATVRDTVEYQSERRRSDSIKPRPLKIPRLHAPTSIDERRAHGRRYRNNTLLRRPVRGWPLGRGPL